MSDAFTLKFGLDAKERRGALDASSPEEREQEFAREQVKILLRYLTLYENGRRVDPDAFAISNDPDRLFALDEKKST